MEQVPYGVFVVILTIVGLGEFLLGYYIGRAAESLHNFRKILRSL